jgi:hypothetical protein
MAVVFLRFAPEPMNKNRSSGSAQHLHSVRDRLVVGDRSAHGRDIDERRHNRNVLITDIFRQFKMSRTGLLTQRNTHSVAHRRGHERRVDNGR